ncbi:metal transporter CNNM4 [Teleopsis dalmanni]|uniref:metal transporter CNNM4 n=1 Tax=Teleopsis dalmanni TaxID=139649 RepID=UPI0018CEBEA1|nr:metal transporter CNNM4 [Teleopsis dalmanni]
MEENLSQSVKCQKRTSVLINLIPNAPKDQILNVGAYVKNGKSISRYPMCSRAAQRSSYTPSVALIPMILLIFFNCVNFGNSTVQKTSDSFKSLDKTLPQNRNEGNVANVEEHNPASESVQARNRRSIEPYVFGIRVEKSSHEVEYGENGVPSMLVNTEAKIRVFGSDLTNSTIIALTASSTDCEVLKTPPFRPDVISSDGKSALYTIMLPNEKNTYFICAKTETADNLKILLTHQSKSPWMQLDTYETLLPLWVSILIILICLCFSALFSGLNLGLMSLDRTELKILRNTGSENERKYAKKIQPVRDQGNYLLCSILLGNVLVNSTFTILLDGLTSGVVAVVCSTLAIVIFGEITPQAICSRHGLAVGAKTIFITRVVMLLTFPLSYPVSRFLDFILGEEIGNVYNRERLKELVKVTTDINDLDKNEVNIISGALELRKKTVADVMTHLDDAFMLSLDAILDFETVSEIMKSGFSRIPVYDGDKKNIVTLLYIKDLAFVDTDDNTPLKTLCEFYQNPVPFVFEDYTLDVMFNQFKDGTIGHIAFVHRVNDEGDGDPFYETIGLITLEDVIEELIQAEIVDETDVYVDNRTKVRRNRNKKQDFSVFAERRENQAIRISPQLTLATYQYLTTAVDAFKKEVISENILRRLLNQDIIHNIKCKGKEKDDPSLFIYQQGKPVDFFVLILEGRVEVTVGKENLLFDSGPFTYFGTQALIQNVVIDSPTQPQFIGSLQSLNMDAKIRQTFVPDYSVRCATDVIYIAIKRSLYFTAKKATLLEKSRKAGSDPSGDVDDEVEKLLHSLNENDKHTRSSAHKTSVRNGSNTASPSLNDISQHSRSMNALGVGFPNAAQQNSQGSNSADIIDVVSLSSQVTSDPMHDLNLIEQHEDAEKETTLTTTTTPLLPKPIQLK